MVLCVILWSSIFDMKPRVFLPLLFCLLAPVGVLPAQDEEALVFPVDTGKYLGPSDLAVSPDGRFLFVAESDAMQLRKVRADGSGVAEILPLPVRPGRIRLFKDGVRLAVLGGEVQGRLLVIDTEKMRITHDIPVGHTPSDVAVDSPDPGENSGGGSDILYISNRFGGDISIVDLAENREIKRLPFGREPISLAVTPDGKTLIVVPQLPEDKAIESAITLTVRIYDTETGAVTPLRLRNGMVDGRDVVITPDGHYAFLTCVVAHFENVPTHVDGGWMVENLIAVVDLETKQYADTFYLDDYGRGAANPWGLCCSADSRFLAVAHSGSAEITLLSLPKLLRILNSRPLSNRPGFGTTTASYPDPGDSTLPSRIRSPVGLQGMRHVVMCGDSLYFTAYYEDSIGRIDMTITEPVQPPRGFAIDPKTISFPVRLEEELVLADTTALPLLFEKLTPLDPMPGVHFERSVARLGPKPVLSDIRFGDQLFHDGTICFEQWQSCSTCHPDGRSDCINWDLLNDGIGNPKNTKSMLLSHETPPAMISGIRKDAETAVRSGIKSILFVKRPEREAEAIDAYLKSLRPVPSPSLIDGRLNESAQRGKRIFNDSRSGCANCHPSPLFTDLRMHDVGTRTYQDTQSDFDTPTLVEIWRTAPYLHDGRYTTIKETIVKGKHFAEDDRLEKLSEQDIDDLVEYVLSL